MSWKVSTFTIYDGFYRKVHFFCNIGFVLCSFTWYHWRKNGQKRAEHSNTYMPIPISAIHNNNQKSIFSNLNMKNALGRTLTIFLKSLRIRVGRDDTHFNHNDYNLPAGYQICLRLYRMFEYVFHFRVNLISSFNLMSSLQKTCFQVLLLLGWPQVQYVRYDSCHLIVSSYQYNNSRCNFFTSAQFSMFSWLSEKYQINGRNRACICMNLW